MAGAITIELANSQPILSGGQIQGKVILQINREFTSVASVLLRFWGTEFACVTYTKSDSTERELEEYCLIKQEAVIVQFPTGIVTSGRYEYAFSMSVPAGLPGKQGTRGDGRDAFLEAHLQSSTLKSLLTSKIEIMLVGPQVTAVPMPSVAPPQTMPVLLMCCYRTGNVTFSASIANTNQRRVLSAE